MKSRHHQPAPRAKRGSTPTKPRSILLALGLFVPLLNFPLMAPCFASQAPSASGFWSGQSNGYNISWTSTDLLANKGPVRVFSAREFAKQGLAHFIAVNKEDGKMPACSYERHFRLLAVVGNLVSFSDGSYASCKKEAHPGGETRFTTIDLARAEPIPYSGHDAFGQINPRHPGKSLRLSDLFPEEEIYTKLKADPGIARVLSQDGANLTPKNLAELLQDLSGKLGENPDCFSVPDDLLTRFAFRRIRPAAVTIELGLPGAGPCRDDITPVLLEFPMSESLKTRLGAAGTVSAPFIKDADWQEGKDETVIRLRTGDRPAK